MTERADSKTFKRRPFLGTALGAGAGWLAGATPSLFASSSGPAITLSPTDREVITFLSRFSNRQFLIGGGVAGRVTGSSRPVSHFIARVRNLRQFLSRAHGPDSPLAGGVSTGNTICFERDGTIYEIEALPNQPFWTRVRNLASRGLDRDGKTPVYFAHEALCYDVRFNRLYDRFSALRDDANAALKPRLKISGLPGWMRGKFATRLHHLKPDRSFERAFERSLDRAPGSANAAQGSATAVVRQLSLMCRLMERAELDDFFRSRQIRYAVRQAFGLDTYSLARTFRILRSRIDPQTIGDGTLWHALFQEMEVPDGEGKKRIPGVTLKAEHRLPFFLTLSDFRQLGHAVRDDAFRRFA